MDLVPEYDGDESYRTALLAAAAKTDKPLAVLASIPAAIDQEAATRLRAAGIPVLESTRTGLLALRHLLARTAPAVPGPQPHGRPAGVPIATPTGHPAPATRRPGRPGRPHGAGGRPGVGSGPASLAAASARRSRWQAALSAGPLPAADLFALLRDYGIPTVAARTAVTLDEALGAAAEIGFPVALKTDTPGISHKSDVERRPPRHRGPGRASPPPTRTCPPASAPG